MDKSTWRQKGDYVKAVFEEVNGDVAVFIVEEVKKTYHKSVSDLPTDAQVGDVFEVEIAGDELRLVEDLPAEKEARLKSNQAKREELLKRKKNLP